jgi:hypothetical protein
MFQALPRLGLGIQISLPLYIETPFRPLGGTRRDLAKKDKLCKPDNHVRSDLWNVI